MVKIRLRRVGAKKQPSYRLVVADSRSPRGGAFINIIGHYNPLTNPETVVIDQEKASYWLKNGAQPTATAARLLAKAGVIEEPKAIKDKMKPITGDKPKVNKKKAKAAAGKPAETKQEPKAATAEKTEVKKEEPKASKEKESETNKEKTKT
jgi:small subunit ribosomal protein S16